MSIDGALSAAGSATAQVLEDVGTSPASVGVMSALLDAGTLRLHHATTKHNS